MSPSTNNIRANPGVLGPVRMGNRPGGYRVAVVTSTSIQPLPKPRGRLTSELSAALLEEQPSVAGIAEPESRADAQLALWMLYELNYRGLEGVPEEHEWDPGLLDLRARLEAELEARLRERYAASGLVLDPDADIAERLFELVGQDDGPSLATYVRRDASREQVLQLLRLRSLYHLREADPTTWQIPRLGVRAKAALVELQYDEYGAGRPAHVHATLYARGLAAMDLDSSYGAHLDRVPGYTLAENNAMSLLGLHRRLRGAAMGHLAAFESTSSLPCRRYAMGLRRLELPEEVAQYFDEHVEADAVHEQVALRHICKRLVELEPEVTDDVLLGAAICVRLEALSSTAMLSAWQREESTLLAQPVVAVG